MTWISRDEACRNRCSGFECSIQAQTQACLCLAKNVDVLRLCLFVALTVDLHLLRCQTELDTNIDSQQMTYAFFVGLAIQQHRQAFADRSMR